MRAISLRQPWAALVVSGIKDIENRPWRTRHRGPVLIHAAQNVADASLFELARKHGFAVSDELERLCASRGGILGGASIVDCVATHGSPWFDGALNSKGRPNYGFVLSSARPLPFVPMLGRLGLFEARRGSFGIHGFGYPMRYPTRF